MSCEGQCSWYEFARAIWETLQLETPLVPVSSRDFPVTVRRPFYSVLENKKLSELKINQMPGWKEALREFLRTFH
jgi:dTDP-4-dehydrorhamnose reductase